jgi:hypothetical protein
MRAPQLGHSRHKRRTNNAALPLDCPAKGYIRANDFVHVPGQGRLVGHGVKARYAAAAPMALYHAPQNHVRYHPPKGVQVTLHLYHKSAKAMGKEGPVITKQNTTVIAKDSHSGSR